MFRISLLLISLLMTACAPMSGSYGPQVFKSAPFIAKGPVALRGWGEAAPFVWQGELYYMNYNPYGSIDITLASDPSNAVNVAVDFKYPSIFVHAGVAYLYGSNHTASIDMVSSSDLISWTAPITVITPPAGATVYNTSVSVDSVGFIMTYEMSGYDGGNFNAFFARSLDLVSWTGVEGRYKRGSYTAAGVVRYINGFYYLAYLEKHDGSEHDASARNFYITRVARSTDLLDWDVSPITMLSPFDGNEPPNCRNTSDVDFIEHNGQVVLTYTNTEQDGFKPEDMSMVGYRSATFNGTLAEMMERFYE